MTSESVILVDDNDVAIGVDDKLAAHRSGALHRAFSVIIVNAAGEILMQQRALTKYHSGGLWSNSCCGHPRPDETILAAAHRRLHEEMGIACDLVIVDSFMYRAELDWQMTEHEYDHILVGMYDGLPDPDPAEVMAWRWSDLKSELVGIAAHPEIYSAWLPLVLPHAIVSVARVRRGATLLRTLQ